MDPELQQKIERFFAPPLPLQTGSVVSSLHLVRREIQDCLLGDVISEEEAVVDPRRHRLFATGMVIMAGIDLLSKFYAGTDAAGGGGDRIKGFTSAFVFGGLPDATDFSEALYLGCRNPLLHSFTLHSTRYRLVLVSHKPSGVMWRMTGDKNCFILNLQGLYQRFIAAVEAYRAELLVHPELQRRFLAMYPMYAGIRVETSWVRAVANKDGPGVVR